MIQECISKSAVRTKFAQHTSNGKELTSDVRTVMDDVYAASIQRRSSIQTTNIKELISCLLEEKNSVKYVLLM